MLRSSAAPAAGRRRGRGRIADKDRAHAREVKTPQEGTGGELAGPRQVHQELHHGGPQLAKLPGEFVNTRQVRGIMFARQEPGALVAQRVIEIVEGRRQPLRLLLGVHAGPAVGHGQSRAQHLQRLVVAQVPNIFVEERKAVGSSKQYVYRKADTQRLRDFGEPRMQRPRCRCHGVGGAGLGESFAIETDQGGARGLLVFSHDRGELAGPQPPDEPLPAGCIGEKPSASLYKYPPPGKPDIGESRGYDRGFLKNLTRDELGLEAAVNHGAGLSRARVADQKNGRQIAELGDASFDAGGCEFCLCVTNQAVYFRVGGARSLGG